MCKIGWMAGAALFVASTAHAQQPLEASVPLSEAEISNVVAVCMTAMRSPAVTGNDVFNISAFCINLKNKLDDSLQKARAAQQEQQDKAKAPAEEKPVKKK